MGEIQTIDRSSYLDGLPKISIEISIKISIEISIETSIEISQISYLISVPISQISVGYLRYLFRYLLRKKKIIVFLTDVDKHSWMFCKRQAVSVNSMKSDKIAGFS